MSYSGIKGSFLRVGDADAVIINQFEGTSKTTYLVDGGNVNDSELVLGKLSEMKLSRIDHLISTHSHADHLGGLIGVVKDRKVAIGRAWINTLSQVRTAASARVELGRFDQALRVMAESTQTERDLVGILQSRGIPISGAFRGDVIGGFRVISPSREFYDEMTREMVKEAVLSRVNNDVLNRMLAQYLPKDSRSKSDEGELGECDTTPENQISLVLMYKSACKTRCLLTSDAGIQALSLAVDADEKVGDLKSLGILQVPHHGSRRNLTQDLIDYFHPANAIASASGSEKHPSQKVIDALRGKNAKFMSTHETKEGIDFTVGKVP